MKALDKKIIACKACPRLIKHCKKIAKEKRKSYQGWEYWGGPVANFGTYPADLLIVGLAPAAHGANRTGRMFTGDRSGDWLYRALHKAGFANQALSESAKDGLKLKNALITAVAHCAPPDNKPTASEISNCRLFLIETIRLTKPKVYLALGGIGWTALYKELKSLDLVDKKPPFSHGACFELKDGTYMVGSYHPSQQNTFTGRLTEEMFDDVFRQILKIL